MAAAQQQQSSGGADNALAPLWITILFLLAGLLIWHFAHAYIVAFVFKIKLFEMESIQLFISNLLQEEEAWIRAVNPASVTFEQLATISTAVGNYIRYPIIFFLLVMSVVIYFSNPTLRFRKTYSMKTLIDEESVLWPQVTPILKLNLLDQHIDEGPWAMAMTPMQFAKKNKLLIEGPPDHQSKGRPTVTVNAGEAKKVFTMQLGAYWESVEKLNNTTKAIFAVCAARINRDREGAEKLLVQMSRSTSSGKVNTSGADALIRKAMRASSIVVDITNRHAYIYTVMASMLELARRDGVLPTAEFLWLKPVDRQLFYMLNNVGRQTAFPEIAGAFSHWLAEKEMRRRLLVPMVSQAVKGLEEAITEQIYIPDEETQS